MYLEFPNFLIKSGKISNKFLENNIDCFYKAINFIHNLPYGRNSNRANYNLIFSELKGTCSTKHAILAQLAWENGFSEIKLQTAVCKFDKFSDKNISKFLLDPLDVLFFPEMHCFLNYKNYILDITFPLVQNNALRFEVINTYDIYPEDIGEKKIKLHYEYIKIWMRENN